MPANAHVAEPPTRPAPRRRSLVEHTRLRDSAYRRSLAANDAICALAACALAVQTSPHASLGWPVLLTLPAFVLAGVVLGLYDHDVLVLRRSTLDEVPALFSLATVYTLALWLADSLFVHGTLTRPRVLLLWGLLLVLLVLGRTLTRATIRRLRAPERCMLIGSRDVWDKLQNSMSLRSGLELAAYLPMRTRAGGRFAPLGQSLVSARDRVRQVVEREDIHRVVVALSGQEEFDENILDGIFSLMNVGLKVSVVPHVLEVVGSAGEFEDLDGLPVLGIGSFGLSRTKKVVKRSFDLVVGGTALFVIAPAMAVIALLVRYSSRGPILFRQQRVGARGEVFEILKFRTMYAGADSQRAGLADANETRGLFKIARDPRVTPVGRILRASSLDELPQLINVMRGDMSLVGPRPLVPEEDARVQGWRRRRLELAPGMTGPWQVLGATRVPLAEMVKIDYLYIHNWSPWSDVKALLNTLPHVLGRKGL